MRRINRRLVLLSFVLVCDVVSVFGRPQQEHNTASSQLKDDLVNRNGDVATPIIVFAETTGDARSHTTKSPPMGDSMKTVSDQLLQSSTSSNVIVSSEIRTVQHNNETPAMKGEAVPVLMDDDVHAVGPYSYKISSDGSTRPTGDLSTWILLGGESSPAPLLNMATIKKVPKPADATAASFVVQSFETSTPNVVRKRKPTTTEKTTVTTHTPVTESPIKLQDSKFKNKTPVIVGKIPTISTVKDKVDELQTTPLPELPPLDNNTRFGTPVVTFPHVPPRQRPSANNTKKTEKPEKPLTTKITSTAVVISKPLNNSSMSTTVTPPTASSTTTAPSSTTISALQNSTEIATPSETNSSTVKSTSLKKKKKKKNKNKRRPVKTSTENAQSKIDEQNTKLPTSSGGRPLSTRIYNYLAREVMPNMGVGLVGLMLTAGLAGLLLYSPLGGAAIPLVPLRRNDPQVHGHSHGPHKNAGYVPPEADNSQPEEQVFGQVLSGMSYGHNPYGRERPDPVPKYKPSYQPSEYPAVHDVPKYTGHDTTKYNSAAHDASKYAPSAAAAAADTTKYSTTHDGTKYAVVESTKYQAPDVNKYSAQDPSKYSTIDESSVVAQDKPVSQYPSQDAPQGETFDETQNADDQTYQNHHYEEIKFDSSNAYETPKYQSNPQVKGAPAAVYQEDQGSFEQPKYPGYVQDVPKEDAVIYNFDNHRADEKESSTAPQSSDPSYSALQGVPKFYDPSTNSEQISVNVHQTMKMEHGPRSLRIRRQVDEHHNEIDGQLPEEPTTTTTTTVTPSTEESSDKAIEIQTDSDNNGITWPTTSTTTKAPSSTETPAPSSNQFSLVDLLRRVAEVKLKMGIEILRNTAASFTQYVNAIQRRMAHMVRSLQKSNDRQQPATKQQEEQKSAESGETRQRRSTRHRMYSN